MSKLIKTLQRTMNNPANSNLSAMMAKQAGSTAIDKPLSGGYYRSNFQDNTVTQGQLNRSLWASVSSQTQATQQDTSQSYDYQQHNHYDDTKTHDQPNINLTVNMFTQLAASMNDDEHAISSKELEDVTSSESHNLKSHYALGSTFLKYANQIAQNLGQTIVNIILDDKEQDSHQKATKLAAFTAQQLDETIDETDFNPNNQQNESSMTPEAVKQNTKNSLNSLLAPIVACALLTRLEKKLNASQANLIDKTSFFETFKLSLWASYTKNTANASKDTLTEALSSKFAASIVAGGIDTSLSSWFSVKKILANSIPETLNQANAFDKLKMATSGLGSRLSRNVLNSTFFIMMGPMIQEQMKTIQQNQNLQDENTNNTLDYTTQLASSLISGAVAGCLITPIDAASKKIVASTDASSLKPTKKLHHLLKEMAQNKSLFHKAHLSSARNALGFLGLELTRQSIDYLVEQVDQHYQLTEQSSQTRHDLSNTTNTSATSPNEQPSTPLSDVASSQPDEHNQSSATSKDNSYEPTQYANLGLQAAQQLINSIGQVLDNYNQEQHEDRVTITGDKQVTGVNTPEQSTQQRTNLAAKASPLKQDSETNASTPAQAKSVNSANDDNMADHPKQRNGVNKNNLSHTVHAASNTSETAKEATEEPTNDQTINYTP